MTKRLRVAGESVSSLKDLSKDVLIYLLSIVEDRTLKECDAIKEENKRLKTIVDFFDELCKDDHAVYGKCSFEGCNAYGVCGDTLDYYKGENTGRHWITNCSICNVIVCGTHSKFIGGGYSRCWQCKKE